MAASSVTVVVVAWKRPKELLRCLGSVYAENSSYDVVVVNNSPTFDSLENIPISFPKARVLASPENLGYAAGNNVGIRFALDAGSESIFLLNDDAVLASDSLEQLLRVASCHPEAAFVGPTVYSLEDPTTVLSAGGRIVNGTVIHNAGNASADAANNFVEVDFLSGSALLVKREAVKRLGLLDERFFMYHEDVDWCYRASQVGYKLLHVPGARVFHPDTRLRDANSALLTYYMTRNRHLFVRKHRLGRRIALRVLLSDLALAASWTVRPKWREKRRQRDALVSALIASALGRYGRADRHF